MSELLWAILFTVFALCLIPAGIRESRENRKVSLVVTCMLFSIDLYYAATSFLSWLK